MTEPTTFHGENAIEVTPVVVLVQVFPARPSSIPDIRDFVRRCLNESPLTEQGNREVGETVFRALLDAAGPTGSIQVAFRIFPEHVEVDVLHSDNAVSAMPGQAQPPEAGQAQVPPPGQAQLSLPAGVGAWSRAAWDGAMGGGSNGGAGPGAVHTQDGTATADSAPAGLLPEHAVTFADWMSTALRREGLTQQAAARMLGVSVKTVSRWVGGTTEPRMRDLRRIQEVFGEVPFQ